MGKGMGGHEKTIKGETDEWLTPKELIDALGPFDLDPCSPVNRPWDTAKHHFNIVGDGLSQDWTNYGKVWLNPPYGPQTGVWLRKLSIHGFGIALVFARTETKWFHEQVFAKAHSILFFNRRICFCRPDGTQSKINSGAPSCLISYNCCSDLERIKDRGFITKLRN